MSDILHKKDLYESTDYAQFHYYSFNRGFTAHGKKLAAAIGKNNRLKDFPIKCRIELDGKMYIIDGQGRHYAAKLLKVPIFYELITDTDSAWDLIIEYNSNVTVFKLNDYIESGVCQGNKHYVLLKNYITQYPHVGSTFLLKYLNVSRSDIKSGTLNILALSDSKLRNLSWVNEITLSVKSECKTLGKSYGRVDSVNDAVNILLAQIAALTTKKVSSIKEQAVASCHGARKTAHEKYFGIKIFNS